MIAEFRGPHRFLSNFWPAEVAYDGYKWPTVEHAYQAAKFPRGSQPFLAILFSPRPGDAKRFGQGPGMRPDWDRIKLGVMEDLLARKFAHPALRTQLLATHPAKLIEGNRWGDTYWGVDLRTGRGENHLGRLLMALRERELDRLTGVSPRSGEEE